MYTGKSVAKHSEAQRRQKARWITLGMTASCISVIGFILDYLKKENMLSEQDRSFLKIAQSYLRDVNTSIRKMKSK